MHCHAGRASHSKVCPATQAHLAGIHAQGFAYAPRTPADRHGCALALPGALHRLAKHTRVGLPSRPLARRLPLSNRPAENCPPDPAPNQSHTDPASGSHIRPHDGASRPQICRMPKRHAPNASAGGHMRAPAAHHAVPNLTSDRRVRVPTRLLAPCVSEPCTHRVRSQSHAGPVKSQAGRACCRLVRLPKRAQHPRLRGEANSDTARYHCRGEPHTLASECARWFLAAYGRVRHPR